MHIIVGYTPTPEGEGALRFALTNFSPLEGVVIDVLNISTGDAPVDPKRATDDKADEIRSMLEANGVSGEYRAIAGAGDAASEIVEWAEHKNADLIVIGLRKRSPMAKFLLGSVAQHVLLEAPCAVLGVKPGRGK